MKTRSLIATGTLCFAAFACSTAATTPVDTSVAGTGNNSTGGSGTAGTGTAPTGGTGNSTGTAGTGTIVTAGTSSGGDQGTSGSAPIAGSGGSDVTSAGTGGSGASSGSGGAPAGGTSAGGSGGGGGGAPSGGAVGTDIVGKWDGALLEYPCAKASTSGYDCSNVDCTGGTATHTQTWTIGGTTGTIYNVTFRVRGVVEVTWYPNATRDADVANGNKNASIVTFPDLFARGGAAQTTGGQSYDYNTYELDVTPKVAGVENVYWLNSVDQGENPHAASTTTHLTFKIDYTKTIKVTGGGTVSLKSFDSNCALVMNCSTSSTNKCAAHWSVDVTGANPPAPSTFTQPYSANGGYGQWVFFDITSVTAAQ